MKQFNTNARKDNQQKHGVGKYFQPVRESSIVGVMRKGKTKRDHSSGAWDARFNNRAARANKK